MQRDISRSETRKPEIHAKTRIAKKHLHTGVRSRAGSISRPRQANLVVSAVDRQNLVSSKTGCTAYSHYFYCFPALIDLEATLDRRRVFEPGYAKESIMAKKSQ